MTNNKEKVCASKKPWYEYRQEVESAIRTLNRLFGNNPWHPHQRIVGYLEGWVAGSNFTENRLEEVEHE